MSSTDSTTTSIERLETILRLRFEPKPFNAAILAGGVSFLGAAALVALWMTQPGMSETLFVAVGVATVLAAGLSFVIMRKSGAKVVSTEFDLRNRRIRIATELQGRETHHAEFSFDEVTEMRVLQQRSEGSQIETLSLGLRKKPFINIGEERRYRSYSMKPFGTPLKDIADLISKETGLPRGKPVAGGLSALAAMIGMRRS